MKLDRPHSRLPRNDLPDALVLRLFERICEISSLPDVAMRIIEIADDPTSQVDDLLEAVRSDPALAMRVMRTVNSAYFGLADKVADLKQAITLLGFDEIRNLALTAYVAPHFREGESYGPYSRLGLWQHSVSVGMTAGMIAQASGRVFPQEAYLAGLLHDFGMILFDQYLHRPFCRVIDRLDGQTPAWHLELELLGFTHAQLGQFVADRWNLPEHLAVAIGFHHEPDEVDDPYRPIAVVVALADCLCHTKEVTSLGVDCAPAPPKDWLSLLGLGRAELRTIFEQIDGVLTAAQDLAMIQVR